VSYQYGTIGTKTINLEVMDTGDLTDDTTQTVTISSLPTVTVTVPNGGENWTVGDADTIRWSSTGDVGNVKIEYSANGGSAWSSVVTSTSDTGSYPWTVPDSPSTTCRVKASSVGTPSIYDISDADFTISPTPTLGEMVLVPAGVFEMGDGVAYCGVQQHQVTLTHSFYLGKHEVTNGEYRDALQWAYDHNYVTATSSAVHDNLDGNTTLLMYLGSGLYHISFSGGVFTVVPGDKDDYPMILVPWYGAAAYCDWVSMSQGFTRAYNHSTWQCNSGDPYGANGYRLPTDAEWEYAARYNDGRIYPWGDESPDCSRANCMSCVDSAVAVESYLAGATSLGLCDMAGNVWEVCNDWWTCDLGTSSQSDPAGPSEGSARVLRGGSWNSDSDLLRCAYRAYSNPSSWSNAYGLRCARSQ